jgi:23S rRNA (adenine2503-C2)-methyltransferase
MRDALDLTHAEMVAFMAELGEPRFRADQIFQWLHARGARSWDELGNVPRALRERLAGLARIGSLTLDAVQRSADGTRKLRYVVAGGRAIESVLIPDGDKLTQCISSQVGCALDCRFCATATLGFGRNLTAGEIAEQVLLARALLRDEEPGRRITNLVYMGMGEPLHNYVHVVRSLRMLTHDLGAGMSARRITVSTAGLVPGIEKLGGEDVRPNLAVSLNATTDAVRDEIMPVNRKWNIARLLGAIRAYPLERRRRVTFEYVLLAGVNDTLEDAARLAQLLRGFPCKVNVIPWNPHPLAPYQRPSAAAIEAFQNEVKRRGLPVYLRTPRGDDIDAACGQLAARPQGEVVELRRSAS